MIAIIAFKLEEKREPWNEIDADAGMVSSRTS